MAIEVDAGGRSFYQPRAFYINFRNGVLGEDGQPSPEEIPAFMHEYAHLVQDQTTLFGVIDFIYLTDTLRDVKIHARANPDGPILVPLENHPSARASWSNCVTQIREVAHANEPWKNGVAWAYIGHAIELVKVPFRESVRELPKAVMRFVNNETEEEYFHPIGPREVKEAYSVAVELLHRGTLHVLNGPEFQYSAIERILARFGDVSPRQMIVVCHWSLQSQFPGVRLLELIDHIAGRGHSTLPDAQELFKICRECALQHRLQELVREVSRGLEEIVNAFSAAGPDDPLARSLRWYSAIATRNLSWCLDSSCFFPIDSFLALEYKKFGAREKASFLRFQDDHPIPSMEHSKGEVFATGPESPGEEAVSLFRGLCDLTSRLWQSNSTSWGCPLRSSCQWYETDSASCERTPWAKERLAGKLCPYAAAAVYADVYQRTIEPL